VTCGCANVSFINSTAAQAQGAAYFIFDVIGREPKIDNFSNAGLPTCAFLVRYRFTYFVTRAACEGKVPEKPCKGDLAFNNVHFQYKGPCLLKTAALVYKHMRKPPLNYALHIILVIGFALTCNKYYAFFLTENGKKVLENMTFEVKRWAFFKSLRARIVINMLAAKR
jgi:ABC-type multidrug transport system fused ATPase/permease subunit